MVTAIRGRGAIVAFPVETWPVATSLGASPPVMPRVAVMPSFISGRGHYVVIDKSYFASTLAQHIQAAGAEPTVEVHLVNGQGHRVRSVIEAADGYLVLEVYQRRAEITGTKGRWYGEKDRSGKTNELHHVIVSYDSISQIVITPTETAEGPRIGFGAR